MDPTYPSQANIRIIEHFANAEEAWFWFVRSEKARAERAKATDTKSVFDRPCDPDDVFRWVKQLYDSGALTTGHLMVMGQYGFLDRMPDPANDDEVVDYIVWTDAFEALEPILAHKGVVA